MKAMLLAEPTQKPLLRERDIPQPQLLPGEVFVRVFAAGVTPTELIWYPTSHQKDGEPRIGAVPCHEFSGELRESATALPASRSARRFTA